MSDLMRSRENLIRITPELGNASPAYALSCFPDVWEDTKIVLRDLKNLGAAGSAKGKVTPDPVTRD